MVFNSCLHIFLVSSSEGDVLQSSDVNALMVFNSCLHIFLVSSSEGDVHLLELVETGEGTSPGNTPENVGASSLHQGHKALILQDLCEAVERSLVLDTSPRGHHHAPPDGVNGVAHESGSHSNSPAKKEGESDSSVGTEDNGLEGVIEAKVHSSVDENTHSRDDKSSVEPLDTIRLQSLDIDVNKTIELSFASLALGIIGQSGSGVVKRVDEHEGEGSGSPATGNVSSEFHPLGSILGGLEDALDVILECEVQGLCWEVSQHIGKISSPEGVDTLSLEDPGGAVNDTSVGLVKTSLLDHLILVLDKELHSLDRSGGCLRDSGGHARQHEVLSESQFLVRHDECLDRAWQGNSCRSESS